MYTRAQSFSHMRDFCDFQSLFLSLVGSARSKALGRDHGLRVAIHAGLRESLRMLSSTLEEFLYFFTAVPLTPASPSFVPLPSFTGFTVLLSTFPPLCTPRKWARWGRGGRRNGKRVIAPTYWVLLGTWHCAKHFTCFSSPKFDEQK